MMWEYVDIETTSYCNAKCSFCNRTYMDFKPKHLDIEVIKKLPFDDIKFALLLGNKGDAIFYPKLFELIKWIKDNHKTWIQIHTNASVHNESWWIELSQLLKGQGAIIYALDGLEDTHKLYRIGTDFNKVVQNITAFNKIKGAKSICQFLKFKHNTHQVDAVRELVRFMGSEKIWIRKSRGFNKNLQRPEGAQTRHEINRQKRKIKCAFLENPSFVLTVDGEIRPCCFMADDNYFEMYFREDIRYPQHIINYIRDPKSINLNFHSFVEIMDSRYYMWIKKNYKHLFRCNQKCKANFDDIVDEECL